MPYKNSYSVAEKKIKSHSKNIIDLIEVGDYVNGEPVEKINIFPDEFIEIMTTTERLTNSEYIKSILTKEQYEQNSYKI